MQTPASRRLLVLGLALVPVVSLLAQTRAVDAWPHWRGPGHDGVATAMVPLTWSETHNLRWRLPIPGRGFSTPVIWDDKLFLTTAIPTGRGGDAGEHRLEVLAVSRVSGQIVWQRTAATVTPHEGYHRTYGSFASHAPATDGRRLYVFFGSRGLFVYDLAGTLLWRKDPGIRMTMRLGFGEGTGVVVDGGRVYLQYDHQEPGAVIALDATDGRELWRAPRRENSSWSTPLVVTHQGRKQLVVTADTKVKAYDVDSGRVIWEVAGLGMNPIPQPVQFRNTAIVMSGYRTPRIMAIRLGHTGDLAGTDAIVWESTRGTAYTGTPALHEGRLYVFSDNGLLSVFDAATGRPHYLQARLPKPYSNKSSPLIVGDRVYLATEEGDVVVVRTGDRLEVLATNTMAGHSFIASPIAMGADLYLRSRTHLFAVSDRR